MQIVLLRFACVYDITVEHVNLNTRLLGCEPCGDHFIAIELTAKHEPSLSLTLLTQKKVKIVGIVIKLLVRTR